MSRIHGKGTKPELKVRQWLWRHGYRYRLNVKSVPGKPDIVMRRYRTAIFVNGCFWHGHFVEFSVESLEFREESSQCCKIPQTNREFWVNKVLGEQNQKKPGTRPAELPDTARQRLAGHRGMGMPTDPKTHRGDNAPSGTAAQRAFLGLAPAEGDTLRCSRDAYFYGSGRRVLRKEVRIKISFYLCSLKPIKTH